MTFTTAPGKLALITGAHGFIGKHLALHLASAGWRVVGLGHGLWPVEEAARWGLADWLNGDIHGGNLRQLMRSHGAAPDLVFHLAGGSSVGAAIANPREDFFRTVATTAELLDWLRMDAPAARLVAVSSAAIYGAGHDGLIREDASATPFSPYGHHKLMMEQLCRAHGTNYGLKVVIARLFSVFGTSLKKQLLWDLCVKLDRAPKTLTLGGSGAELRDWTDVRDVVRALLRLGAHAATEAPAFNVGTGIASSVRSVATEVTRCWATSGGPEIELGFSGQSRAGDPFSLVADPAKLTALGLNWLVPVEQGLADYVRWFRTQKSAGYP